MFRVLLEAVTFCEAREPPSNFSPSAKEVPTGEGRKKKKKNGGSEENGSTAANQRRVVVRIRIIIA